MTTALFKQLANTKLSATLHAKHTAIYTALALIAALNSQSLFAQGFGTITPGGVEPQLERPQSPSEGRQPEYTVPAVIDRPVGIDGGPTISVEQFQLSSFEDHPEDIKQSNVMAILNSHLEKHPEGFSIGQLQMAANEVTQYYRSKGYILAQAYIPQQDVENGVVTIGILVGHLGKVSARNNTLYSQQQLIKSIDYLAGATLQQQVMETTLLRLNDLPGFKAGGIFRPGSNIGEADLIINVIEEKQFEGQVVADNYGVDTTGKERLIASVAWNNVSGNGDKLSITALQTFNPTDSLYGAIGYELPIFSPAFKMGINFSNNDYNIGQQGFSGLDLSGETQQATIFGQYSFVRSRNFNLNSTVSFSRKKANIEALGLDLGEDNLSVLELKLNYDSVDARLGGGINRASISLSEGFDDFLGSMDSRGDGNSLRQDGSGQFAGGDFSKINARYTRLQSITNNHALLLRASGQASDDVLTSLEQFSLGGPNSVRAYPISEYVRDSGIFTSIEWVMNAPGFADKPAFADRNWGDVLQVSIFADYAEGKLNKPNPATDSNIEISGAGVSFDLRISDQFFIRADIATPIGSRDASNGDNPQYWITSGFDF